jgi:hypothetical protein
MKIAPAMVLAASCLMDRAGLILGDLAQVAVQAKWMSLLAMFDYTWWGLQNREHYCQTESLHITLIKN